MESLEPRLPLSASSIGGKPFVDVGPSDNVAWDQPRVTVQFLTGDLDPTQEPNSTNIVGPNTVNLWLLDTGANTTLAFQTAVEDMENAEPVYETDGKFFEIGVGGFQEFDISESYTFDFAGTKTNERLRLTDARIISDPTRDVSIAGPYGIAGMPLMTERVTTLDFTPWLDLSDFNFLMETDFTDTLPDPWQPANDPTGENAAVRYTVSVDNRISFDPQDGLDRAGNPELDAPMWADVPFLTGELKNNDLVTSGNLLFDTGAQVSILSSRMAFDLGLDSNQDGELNELDAAFARNEQVTGVGGLTNTPVFLIDEVHIPTDQGPDLVWTDLQWLILDIYEGIDGVFGFDNMTSGWIENFGVPGNAGYLLQSHLDFRGYETTGQGKVHFDLNPAFLTEVDPVGFGATVIESAGSTIVGEIVGHDDTYEISLNTQPTADVTVTFEGNNGQVAAFDSANPANQFITFTTSNWDQTQTVRVRGLDDSAVENYRRAFIRNLSSSADPNYDGVGMPRVSVGVIDNDLPGVMILPTGGETVVSEDGAADYYDIVLTHPPTQIVSIDLNHTSGQIVAENNVTGTSSLIFTASNWNVPQRVKVTAVDDSLSEGNHSAFISHSVVTEDTEFQANAFVLQEKVEILDNEVAQGTTIAVDDFFDTVEDTPLVVTTPGLLGNDVMQSMGPISVDISPGFAPTPSHGTVTNLGSDGTFTYTPDDDFHGTDTFTYRVIGGDGSWDVATVRIQVAEQLELESVQFGNTPAGATPPASQSVIEKVQIELDGVATISQGAIEVERIEGEVVTLIPVNMTSSMNTAGKTVVELGFTVGSSEFVNEYGSLKDGAYRLRIRGDMIFSEDGSAMGTEMEIVDGFYAKYGDYDASGDVGLTDFARFRSTFGKSDGDADYADEVDYDRNGSVGLSDFAAFRRAFGN
ncbi:hypothetical protein LF1_46100 [Rubripirellula obstinata]|uniref:Peptidase A2 domain-containing protein n=1 Tax=Rubripirellula obstinata TaxID=406547 RepID=A0A5B1CQB5_9BACT|nr:cadherin-like domain-containing protein [Rubripirellula obstinata]KAA1262049.1 hypothetical protein LF1_46100 [Rubripirellula obstinata]